MDGDWADPNRTINVFSSKARRHSRLTCSSCKHIILGGKPSWKRLISGSFGFLSFFFQYYPDERTQPARFFESAAKSGWKTFLKVPYFPLKCSRKSKLLYAQMNCSKYSFLTFFRESFYSFTKLHAGAGKYHSQTMSATRAANSTPLMDSCVISEWVSLRRRAESIATWPACAHYSIYRLKILSLYTLPQTQPSDWIHTRHTATHTSFRGKD